MNSRPEPADALDPRTAALAAAVLEIARHVGDDDLPAPRWYALLRSAELLAGRPALASLLGEGPAEEMAADPLHLTSVELEPAAVIEGGTARTAAPLAQADAVEWPDIAVGGAMVCEIPAGSWSAPGAQDDAGLDPQQPLRAAIGVLEDGTRWSALRGPGRPDYVMGEALLPDLADALTEGLAPAQG